MKIEIPERKKWVHEMVIPVRWGDMDIMGHVNNTVYFRYMESVRIEWFVKLGYDPSPKGQGPIIVNAFCNFYNRSSTPRTCWPSCMSATRGAPPLKVGSRWSAPTSPG